ncbi:MAG: hypothetical protein HYR56_12075 [Acidobacteria bacterium]|nr:hypothetical protein [Acidobacteriota bacterium]MBI3422895.1 hypothetical protein [Acidobacteriota bacterium]
MSDEEKVIGELLEFIKKALPSAQPLLLAGLATAWPFRLDVIKTLWLQSCWPTDSRSCCWQSPNSAPAFLRG